jgi:transposase-like protein
MDDSLTTTGTTMPTIAQLKQQVDSIWVASFQGQVVRLLTKDVDACLTFEQFDLPLHRLVLSTNLLECFFREFRAKLDEIGAFPNELSCLVVFHLIVIRDDTKHDRGKTAKTG